MNNINKFKSSLEYQNRIGNYPKNTISPAISYAEDIDFLYYDERLDNETDDIKCARVGDYVLSNQDGKKIFVGKEVYESKYINDSNWVPIAKVVLPYNVFGDKTVRCCSLKKMDFSSPNTGSTNGRIMCWGNTSLIQKLGTNTAFRVIPGTSTIVQTAGTLQLATDRYIKRESFDNRAFYNANDNNNSCLPFYYGDKIHNGFISDSEYIGDHTFINQLDGKLNTQIIADNITGNVFTQTVTNSASSGNYPAAQCCINYFTAGTAPGDWYLPSSYELIALCERSNVLSFNNVLSNYRFWSSTQINDLSAYAVTISDIKPQTKGTNLYVLAFIAFNKENINPNISQGGQLA